MVAGSGLSGPPPRPIGPAPSSVYSSGGAAGPRAPGPRGQPCSQGNGNSPQSRYQNSLKCESSDRSQRAQRRAKRFQIPPPAERKQSCGGEPVLASPVSSPSGRRAGGGTGRGNILSELRRPRRGPGYFSPASKLNNGEKNVVFLWMMPVQKDANRGVGTPSCLLALYYRRTAGSQRPCWPARGARRLCGGARPRAFRLHPVLVTASLKTPPGSRQNPKFPADIRQGRFGFIAIRRRPGKTAR